MHRRQFLAVASVAGSSLSLAAAPPSKFEPTWESLKTHAVPDWYEDAKLGIFVHWGLYSVPAWAPPSGELGKVDFNTWFYKNPYAEWYLNSIRLKESETYKHHAAAFGENFDYYTFADTFNKESAKWDPNKWADVAKNTGARYMVLTTKHHDGFTLWPSRVKNPKRQGSLGTRRDIVGELTKAVRARGMRMGLYYSGGLDWTFEEKPVAKMADLMATAPKTQEYADYADAHWRELIERYEPSVLWNDITYPKLGRLADIFADYYNKYPDGLVNNRFTAPHADFTTPEYSVRDRVKGKKWEVCRGLGFSFGYNQVEDQRHVIAPDKLIELVVGVVSEGGNILLNIGPRPDGSIPDIQMDRLTKLGAWMKVNGEGIFGTRPWTTAASKTETGEDVRFTRKGDNTVYAFVYKRPASGVVTIPELKSARKVELLGFAGQPLQTEMKNAGLAVTLPPAFGSAPSAFGLKVAV